MQHQLRTAVGGTPIPSPEGLRLEPSEASMRSRSLLPCVVSLTSFALLAGCDSAGSPAPTEPAPAVRADFAARGRPDIQRVPINDSFTDPPGGTCDNFAVHWDVVGMAAMQIWETDDAELFKVETNVWLTYTNTTTGASVTNHQTDAQEFLFRDGVVEVRDNGGLTRITSPGEGLIGLFAGHGEAVLDFSVDPPQLISVHYGPVIEADFCALIG
jgi:hypothetical protein